MSSFSNAVKGLRKTHRERGQPSARSHLGLLEKHKDYVLRAKNFHQKKNALKLLREKARNRNPDEFNFKMINSKVAGGVCTYLGKKDKGKGKKVEEEQEKLLMTQNMSYTKMKIQTEKKEIERLEVSLHFSRIKPNHHLVFRHRGDTGDDSRSQQQEGKEEEKEPEYSKEQKKVRQELAARKRRFTELTSALDKMQTKKNLVTDKRPHSWDKKHKVYKWKMERLK